MRAQSARVASRVQRAIATAVVYKMAECGKVAAAGSTGTALCSAVVQTADAPAQRTEAGGAALPRRGLVGFAAATVAGVAHEYT